MRFLARTATWVLAAVGVKALYDRLVPKARDVREPSNQALDTAKTSSREFAEHAKAAGTEVLADARDRSVEIRDVATDAMAKTSSQSGTDGSSQKASGSGQKSWKRWGSGARQSPSFRGSSPSIRPSGRAGRRDPVNQ